MKVDVMQFTPGQQVWYRADLEKTGFVDGVIYDPTGGIRYSVRWYDFSSRTHFGFELSSEKSFEGAAPTKETP